MIVIKHVSFALDKEPRRAAGRLHARTPRETTVCHAPTGASAFWEASAKDCGGRVPHQLQVTINHPPTLFGLGALEVIV